MALIHMQVRIQVSKMSTERARYTVVAACSHATDALVDYIQTPLKVETPENNHHISTAIHGQRPVLYLLDCVRCAT
jgi:hypothetical protein